MDRKDLELPVIRYSKMMIQIFTSGKPVPVLLFIE